jgi:hypothetical protein
MALNLIGATTSVERRTGAIVVSGIVEHTSGFHPYDYKIYGSEDSTVHAAKLAAYEECLDSMSSLQTSIYDDAAGTTITTADTSVVAVVVDAHIALHGPTDYRLTIVWTETIDGITEIKFKEYAALHPRELPSLAATTTAITTQVNARFAVPIEVGKTRADHAGTLAALIA